MCRRGVAIEMLMSLHSGEDSWRATEDGVMSPPDIRLRRE